MLAASNQAAAAPVAAASLVQPSAAQAAVRAAAQLPAVAATPAAAIARAPLSMAQAASAALAPVAAEALLLQRAGWPLYALADRYSAGAPLDEQANCIAVAVYHEARGETLEGQLAVAKVIMNRAASGRYPGSWCEVVRQPWQFSFVNPRTGDMPGVDEGSDAWRKALGITRLAISGAVPTLSNDVLWYHADYVAPSWGRRLTRVDKIGAHIFYRA